MPLHLSELLDTGAVKVFIDGSYSMQGGADAIAHMAGHHSRGTVVISVEAPKRGDER